MSALLNLPPDSLVLAFAACFLAGVVRGFSGFGLSALVMAILATTIPPIELIPALWFLEMAASLALLKGGWSEADRRTALTLMLAAAVGLPLTLLISLSLDPLVSKFAALSLLIALAVLQLSRIKLSVLSTTSGTLLAGFCAGAITGIAGAGGMLIALYMLARDLPARRMRATLNIYLLGGGVLGLIAHLGVGTMTGDAAARGLVLSVPALLGVFAGKALFTPRWEPYYKPVCLVLLIGLATLGLLRLVFGN